MSRFRWRILLVFGLLYASLAQAAEPPTLEQAIAEYQAENYEEALVLLQPLAADGKSDQAAYYLGLTLKRMGNNRAALPYLLGAANLGISDPALARELAESYLAIDDYANAERWLAEVQKSGTASGEVEYLRGVALARQQKHAEALAAFDRAVALDPALQARADFQRALVYGAQNRPSQARAALQAILAASPESELADYARDYERRYAAALASHRSWRPVLQVGYMYDSNATANPETNPNNLSLPDEEDHALVANAWLDYQPLLEGRLLFSGRYALQTLSYADNSDSNQVVQTLTLTPGVALGRNALTAPLSYALTLLDGEGYQQTAGIKPTLSLRLGQTHLLQLLGGFTRRDMLRDYANTATRLTEDRSGDLYSAGVSLLHFCAGGRGLTTLRYEYSDEDTDGSNWRNSGHRLGIAALLPLGRALTGNLSGEVLWQGYEGRNSFFGVVRRDETYNAGAGLNWQMTTALKLFGQYQFTRADSNVYIYDYSRHAVTAGVEYSF